MLQTHEMRLENIYTSAMTEVSNSTVHLSQNQNKFGSVPSQVFQSPSCTLFTSSRGRHMRGCFGPRGGRQFL